VSGHTLSRSFTQLIPPFFPPTFTSLTNSRHNGFRRFFSFVKLIDSALHVALTPLFIADGKLRALSLDGGGFRGLGMLYVLGAITKAANARNRKPTDPQLKPREIFDIIVGSSAGGLVAVLVGRLGLDCDEAIAAYTKLATALYGTSRPAFMKTLLANQKLDDAAIANYEAAVAGLAGSAQTFYTDPVSNAKVNSLTIFLPSNS
jgi:hypothetical protein